MTRKLTYEELERRVEELEEEAAERKRMEVFCESEPPWRSLLENSPTYIAVVDRDGNIQYINRTAHGVTMEEVIGKNIDDFKSPVYHEISRNAIKKVFQFGESGSYQVEALGQDKTTSWFEVHFGPIKRDGEVIAIAFSAVDITERKRAEEALLEERNFSDSLLLSSPTFCVATSPTGQTLMMNETMLKSLGYEKDEVLGTDYLETFIPEDDRQLILKLLNNLVDLNETIQNEAHLLTKDGRELLVEWHTRAMLKENGEFDYFFSVGIDIAERRKTEKALRESEERFRSLFEGSLDARLLIDPESLRILDANPATSELLLRSHEEIVGLPHTALFPPHLEKFSKELFARYVQDKGQERPVDTYVLRSDSSEIQVEILAQIIQISGTPILYCVFRDITERKRAEQALREGERFLSDIFASIQDGISILNDTLTIIRVNPTMERWYSHTMPLVGKKCYEAYHERNEPCEVCPTRQTLETVESAYEVVPRTGPGGEIVGWLDLYSFPLLDRQTGQLKGVIEYVRDITDRKLAEDALRESEERYERAEKIGHFGHWDGDFIEDWSVWSKETYRIFGIDPAKFKPTYRAFLNFIHPEDKEKLKSAVQSVIRQGGEIDLEYRIIRPDGEVRFIHSTAEIHLDKNGKPRKSLGMLHDITERKRMKQEIAKVQQLESLGILAGGIAHDFNNILTVILANISMAKLYGALQDDISQMLTDAEKASLRAKKLTQQLLTFAKGGAPIKKVMSISGLLKDTAEFTLSGSKVRCEFSMPDDLWPIEADAGQISQVIQNLIINADQAMPRGGTVKICAENAIIGENDVSLIKEGRYLKISITDQGTGIAKKDLPNIFDPFFTTKQKGSGLGLATAFSVVNNHDGHIGVDSEVEVGTTFHVYLPTSRKTSKPEERSKGKPTRGKGKILLIDDEEIIRKAAGEVLKRIGYQVTVAKDHEEGIRLYEKALKGKHPFDAIIMDLTIPGDMGAREAIKKFKKIDRDVKVIVSSGYSDDPTMSNYVEYGFRGVVEKPYKIDDLAEVIHMVLGRA